MTETLLSPGTAVLIVDSEPIVADSLELLVRELGASTVQISASASHALSYLESGRPSLAFIDLHVGSAAFDTLVARLTELSTKFVLVTTYSANELAGTPWEGMVAVEKPFTDMEITAAIDKVMTA